MIFGRDLRSMFADAEKGELLSSMYQVYWGSEICTSLDFEWRSKRVWATNGLDFEWDRNLEAQLSEIQTNRRHFSKTI